MNTTKKEIQLLAKVANKLWQDKSEGLLAEYDTIIDYIREVVEEDLQAEHAKEYHGLDDDMPEDYERWLEEKMEDDEFLQTLIG